MLYISAATKVLNSGLVADASFRKKNSEIGIYELNESSKIKYGTEKIQYLCRVKPGAPSITDSIATNINKNAELSRDCLATLVYKSIDDSKHSNPPMYLLSQQGDDFWQATTQTLSLTIDRPRTSHNVFERWINTEDVYIEKSVSIGYRDPYFNGVGKITAAKNAYPKPPPKSEEKIKSHPPHPAVRAVGIKVFENGQGTPITNTVIINNYDDYLEKKLTLEASCGEKRTKATITFDKKGKKIEIELEPNKIYQIRLYSLIPKFLYEGDLARIKSEIFDVPDKNNPNKTEKVEWDKDYIQGNESEFWIECLANPDFRKINFEDTINYLFNEVTVKESGALVTLNVANSVSKTAHLFSGLEIEQHKWRWTGYPSELDIVKQGGLQDPQLKLRFMDFWGARSRYYEKVEPDGLSKTSQAEGYWQTSYNKNYFIVKSQIIHRWEFKGFHGAHHCVYLLKPRFRYQSLINKNSQEYRILSKTIGETSYQDSNIRPFLVLAVLPINDLNFKLPTLEIAYSAPVLEWDKPNSDNSRLVNAGSGVMCVFDEVFYRNDDMVTSGGLAERFEISVSPARVKGLKQIGPDPMSHPQPIVKSFTKSANELSAELEIPHRVESPDDSLNSLNWKVANTPFIGLTKDGLNPKISQTATVIYLDGNFTHQYDILAEVRTRRWLEPTLIEGAEIPVEKDAYGVSVNEFKLPKRLIGQDWVPINYCFFNGESRRQLVSWHKGKWGKTSEETWRKSIIHQELKIIDGNDCFRWITTSETSPYENIDYDKNKDDVIKELQDPLIRNCRLYKWIASDYSNGRWMSFLGAPWRVKSLTVQPFGLLLEKNELKIKRRSIKLNDSTHKPEVSCEFISQDLIIHPLALDEKGYFNGVDSSRLRVESHRFNILFVYETFKPDDQADVDEKYCKLHSLWHPTRAENTETGSPSILRFIPMDDKVSLAPNKNYVGALYEFFCENISEDVTKNIKINLLDKSKGKAIERLNKLWFPESTESNSPRPLLMMRPPMMSYMSLFNNEENLNTNLREGYKIEDSELRFLISKKVCNQKFKLFISESESFWQVYDISNITLGMSEKRGNIFKNGNDFNCLIPNGNCILKLTKNINNNYEVQFVFNGTPETSWEISLIS